MKSNDNKCHLLVSTNSTVNIRVANFDIKNSHCEKLLGVKFNHKLTFNSHSSDLCKKARVTPYMNISKRRIIMNAFLSHNSVTALLYGCVTVMLTIVK